MASKRRKSAAIALAFIGVAGLSLASASTLGITPGTLQAGSVALVDCQGTPVAAQLASSTYAATGGFTAGNVALSGINFNSATNNCNGKKISATLYGTGGVQLGTTASTTINAATASVAIPAGISATSVTGIAVVISDN